MNKSGFTLVELLATIVVLSIIVGITILTTNGIFSNAKNKTEEVFVKSLVDALTIYLDSDAKNLRFENTPTCIINKKISSATVYKNATEITFRDIINSEYTPLLVADIINPANENVQCNLDTIVNIYRDTDYVYYYHVNKEDFDCLLTEGSITNIPSECIS